MCIMDGKCVSGNPSGWCFASKVLTDHCDGVMGETDVYYGVEYALEYDDFVKLRSVY